MAVVNSGNAAPKMDRRTEFAARTEAAYMTSASVLDISLKYVLLFCNRGFRTYMSQSYSSSG